MNKMLKKYKSYLLILLFVFIVVGLYQVYVKLTSSSATYYSSVKELIEHNGQSKFIDFYDPKAYYDTTKEKKTISQINDLDIYYNGSSEDEYNIPFDIIQSNGTKVELHVSISFIKETYEDHLEVINKDHYDIYMNKGASLLVGVCDEYEVCIKYFPQDMKELSDANKRIGIEMIDDIMRLNDRKSY